MTLHIRYSLRNIGSERMTSMETSFSPCMPPLFGSLVYHLREEGGQVRGGVGGENEGGRNGEKEWG